LKELSLQMTELVIHTFSNQMEV
jgi:hypothetical protein